MKTILFKYRKTVFIIFIYSFLSFNLYADLYTDALNSIEKNETEKGLSLLYKYIESDSADSENIYKSLNAIIIYEKDINKIINNVKIYSAKLENLKKEKSEILLNTAEIAELSGKTEDAVELYISSYNVYPLPENSNSLLVSSRILIDNGEFEKALKQIVFYKKLPLDNNSIYKAEIIESLIYILSGDKVRGEQKLSEIIIKKDISVMNLISAVFMANNYNLDNISGPALKKLNDKNKSSDLSSLLSFSSLISPAAYFNYSSFITDNPETDIKISESNPLYIQTGSYSANENAEKMIERLKKIGFNGEIRKTKYKGKDIYKVLIPAESKEKAQKYHIILKENSIESFLIFN